MTHPVESVLTRPPGGTPPPGADQGTDNLGELSGLFDAAGPVDVRALLARYPQLKTDKQLVLDLAYEEYCQRLDAGEPVDPEAFCERFGSFKTSLRKLLEAHAFLEEQAVPVGEQPAEWPQPGQRFLGFVLHSELGRGAFARVFLASEPALGDRTVALKVTLLGSAEAKTLGRLNHPHIVPVYSVQHDPASGLAAICMPYLGSSTLGDVLDAVRASNRLPGKAEWILRAVWKRTLLPDGARVDEAGAEAALRKGSYVDGIVHLGLQLAEALAYVHEMGFSHQDLKPSNVLMRLDGRPVLLDFNLSIASERAGPYVGGTLPYMAPEQLLAAGPASPADPLPIGSRSDLFSLGVILTELLTGVHPFGPIPAGGSSRQLCADLLERQRKGPRSLADVNPQVDRSLAGVIERCLAYHPDARPASAKELAADLRCYLSRWRRGRRWVARHRGTSLAAAVLLLAAGSAGGYALAVRLPDIQRQYLAGNQAFQEGRYQEAIESYNRALDKDPDLVEALLARAQAYEQLGSVDQASDDYLRAEKQLQDGKALACIGYFLNKKKHAHPEAIRWYKRAVAAGYAPAEVFNNLGYSYLRLHQLADARSNLDEAIRLAPRLQAAYHNRAVVGFEELIDTLRRPGAPEADLRTVFARALADFRRAIELGPPAADLYYRAARLCVLAPRKDPEWGGPALAYLQEALAHGKSPKALQTDRFFADLGEDPRTKGQFEALLRQPNPAVRTPEADCLINPGPVARN